jgi:hypothetical protein
MKNLEKRVKLEENNAYEEDKMKNNVIHKRPD